MVEIKRENQTSIRHEAPPAVDKLEPELEGEPGISSEAVELVKEEEAKEIIEPSTRWNGARDLEIGIGEVPTELEEMEIPQEQVKEPNYSLRRLWGVTLRRRSRRSC